MGINKLRYYITKYGNYSPITERISRNKIYNTRVIYLDALGKLIEIYNQYLETEDVHTLEGLFNYEAEKFSTYLMKIAYYQRKVYVFVDFHYNDEIYSDELIFTEYLPKTNKDFKVYRVDGVLRYPEEVSDVSSLSEEHEYTQEELQKVWYRYLVRIKCKESMSEIRRREVEEKIHETYEDNIFRKFVHEFEKFANVLKGKEELRHVSFFGCSVESDFAITKHIETYNKNTYPIIITNDTDLAALLCDTNCLIKYVFGRKTYFIHPPTFWKKIFGIDLPADVIKILCVMKGVDYNFRDRLMLFRDFNDILKVFGVKSFGEITLEMLFDFFKRYFELHKNNENSKYTALALNIYLVNMENTFYEI